MVARASRGDVEAFSQLVQEHSGLVSQVARLILGREEAQDASQEVWVRVWRYIRTFRGDSAFTTWLHRIAVNTCLTLRQRGLRRRYHEVSSERLYLSEPCGKDADPEAAAPSTERQEEIQRALRNVREEHRDALVLRHVEGLSYAEIAEIFQVPEGTAKGWVSRGRAAMFLALSQERALLAEDKLR